MIDDAIPGDIKAGDVRADNAPAAIVTGASRGIGFAIARRLVSDGVRVCLTGRNEEALADAAAALGDQAIFVAGKAHDPQHQAETVARSLDTFGRLDYLVNNVGTNPVFGPMIDLDAEVLRKVFEVNVLSAFSWTQRVHQAWMDIHGGAIVNVSSVGGLSPAPGLGAYGMSKAALNYLTEQLALELSPGVRVNAVAPAVVKTKFATALYEGREEQVSSVYPLGRLGEPNDVAGVVAFLLSDDAAWMTGQTLVLDGGATLVSFGLSGS